MNIRSCLIVMGAMSYVTAYAAVAYSDIVECPSSILQYYKQYDYPADKAVQNGDFIALKALATPKIINRLYGGMYGKTLLIAAVQANQPDIIRLLIEMGALVGLPDSDGYTPLHHAARQDNTEAAQLLLQAPPIDITNDTIEMLIRTYFFNNFNDVKIEQSQDSAIQEKNIIDARTWLLKNNVNRPFIDVPTMRGYDRGQTPLMRAAESGKEAMVKFLLERNANCNLQTQKEKYTALHYAALKNRYTTAQLLLSYGADYNISEKNGYTPVSLAQVFNCTDMIALLSPYLTINPADQAIQDGNFIALKALATPKIINRLYGGMYDKTLLIAAVQANKLDIIKLLIEMGALVGLPDSDGDTALHHAAQKDNTEAAQLLLQASPIDITDDTIEPLFHINFFKRFGDMKIEQSQDSAIQEKNIIDARTWLLRNNVNRPFIDVPTMRGYNRGETPLMLAAKSGKEAMVKFLLERNANCNLQTQKGKYTALHYAALENRYTVAQLLLSYGADRTIKGKNGYTPLAFAQDLNYPDMIALLSCDATTNDASQL